MTALRLNALNRPIRKKTCFKVAILVVMGIVLLNEWSTLEGVTRWLNTRTQENPCAKMTCRPDRHCIIEDEGRISCVCNLCEPTMDPVCGHDGIQYDSLCEMKRFSCTSGRKISVAYKGPCKTPCANATCGPNMYCSFNDERRESCECNFCKPMIDPVCGHDGIQYENRCEIKRFSCMSGRNISIAYQGPCNIYKVPEYPGPCQAPATRSTRAVNLAKIESYPLSGAQHFLESLGFHDVYTPPSRDIPVIVTAASSDHYREGGHLIDSIEEYLLPSYPNLSVIYFDLGLDEDQKTKIMSLPWVTYRKFPLQDYPEHLSYLPGCAWKPVIIQMMLKEMGGFVLWADSSILFRRRNISSVFNTSRKFGICHRQSHFEIANNTDPLTLRFLGEDGCNFRPLRGVEANFLAIYNTKDVRDYVMKPWVACALQFGCMVTKKMNALHCRNGKLGLHHLYDQTVLSIILHRLFPFNREQLYVQHDAAGKLIAIRRRD